MSPARRTTFQMGEVQRTHGVVNALDRTGEELTPYLERFLHGDWGLITEEDRQQNNQALLEDYGGGELVGIYQLRDRTEIYITTDADRTKTIVALMGEL